MYTYINNVGKLMLRVTCEVVCVCVCRNLDYVCKENGRCIVDVSRRNQCQACRFTKCLQVNMKRDGTFYFENNQSIL